MRHTGDRPDKPGGGADFPAGFLWGAATSAHQVEGGNVNSDWWDFEHRPGTAARESSGDGIDHLHRYGQDFLLLKSLGHNGYDEPALALTGAVEWRTTSCGWNTT